MNMLVIRAKWRRRVLTKKVDLFYFLRQGPSFTRHTEKCTAFEIGKE